MTATTRELIKSSLAEVSKGYSLQEKAKCEELMTKIVEQEMAPKDAMGLNETFLDEIYEMASNFFKAGKYEKAEGMYRILMILEPLEPRYPMAVATCLHRLKKYVEAIQYYSLTSVIDENDPLPYYYSSDCFYKFGQIAESAFVLKIMLQKLSDHPEYAKLKARAEESLKSLEDEMKVVPLKDEFVVSQVERLDDDDDDDDDDDEEDV